MKKKLLFFALPLLALTACSSDESGADNSDGKQSTSGVPILIDVSEEPLTDTNGAGTRANITFKENLLKFNMPFLTVSPKTYTNAKANRTDANHQWESDNTWPSGVNPNTPCYFFAYANTDYNGLDYSDFGYDRETNYRPDDQYLDFSIDEYTRGQMDLLVATQTCTQNENQIQHKPVHFQFSHACAALQFSICKTASLAGYQINVTKVVLHNILKHGTYYFNSRQWTMGTSQQGDTYADYTLAEYDLNSSLIVPNENEENPKLLATSANDYMFVIPQKVTPWSEGNILNQHGAYLEIECTIQEINGSQQVAPFGRVYLPFGDTWEMGYIHRYNIRMGTKLLNSNGESVF